jgi:hypothetical protein
MAVWLVVRSLLSGAALFLGAMVAFFVGVAWLLYMAVAGAMMISGVFALLCWLLLHDQNALRGFLMISVGAFVWLLPAFLVKNLFRAAMKPRDEPYLAVSPQVSLASNGSPWMRHNPSGRTP